MIPPKASAQSSITSTVLAELCYQYIYDHRNRLVEKKIPGKGWESIVYDNLDRPVLTQDANLKESKIWLFTKYDALGRVVYTGRYYLGANSTETRVTLQNTFNAKIATQNFETKITMGAGTGFSNTYYSNTNFPDTNLTIWTVNYYDNYNFNLQESTSSVTSYGVTSTSNVKGLPTDSRVYADNNKWITTITYYDDRARPI
ncbi:hypothetical protein [Polaribacter cellanae]|uniref:RHS repeat-associated core domain-containing protein n=1 Tax=Polaribacter cellanae TaxID=2818493 RepID=A0A975CK00_9FLAO|nr:hypothetical protein [Polaribacter cellanae]QTE21153.1 hypothetical protein J3359_09845 [Polaribacter cellanae]